MKLTAKQKMFVAEYLIDLNATQAAIRAGYSKHTAKSVGCENLTKPDIAQEIQEAMDERTKRTRLDADSILNEIAGIGYDEEEKSTDRLRALELLGKHRVLFTEKVHHEGELTFNKIETEIVRPDASNSNG